MYTVHIHVKYCSTTVSTVECSTVLQKHVLRSTVQLPTAKPYKKAMMMSELDGRALLDTDHVYVYYGIQHGTVVYIYI